MDINAKFTADFTEFNTGVTVAEEKLKGIAGAADQTAESLAKVEQPLNAMSTAAQQGATTSNTLVGALGQVDKTLGLAGINISKTMGALKELGQVAGKTAGELGLIATAGATVASFFVGWNIGRHIAAFFDLDKTIGNATARLLGFGDVAAEVAGAQMDELARASQRAGRAISDLAEARKINAAAVTAEQLAQKEAKAAHDAELESLKKILALDLDWKETLRTLTQAQKEQIETQLKLGAAVEDVARVEHVTENQVKAVANAMEERKKAADAYAETVKKVQAIETSQLTGRIVGLTELGRVEEVQSDARIQRAIKEVKAFEDAMAAEAAAAQKFNAAREGAGATEDPILKAAMERDAATARANQRWPQGGADASAIIAAAATKFQDAVNQVTAGNKPGGFMSGQLPFSQLTPPPVTINVSGVLDPRTIRELTDAVAGQLMGSTSRMFGSR